MVQFVEDVVLVGFDLAVGEVLAVYGVWDVVVGYVVGQVESLAVAAVVDEGRVRCRRKHFPIVFVRCTRF